MPDQPKPHWRRHEGAHDNCVAATACGRLVQIDNVTNNPSETDCPECAAVYRRHIIANEAAVLRQSPGAPWTGGI